MRAFESHVRVFERKQQEFKSYVRVFVMLCRFIYEGNGCDEIIVGQNMCMKVLFCCLSKYLKLRASCVLFSATPLSLIAELGSSDHSSFAASARSHCSRPGKHACDQRVLTCRRASVGSTGCGFRCGVAARL